MLRNSSKKISISGWIDLQINGFGGVDFSGENLTLKDISQVNNALLKRGTIGYCPTIITSNMDIYERNLPLIGKAIKENTGAKILGIHIEGPFLNKKNGYRGIHPAEYIISPSIEIFETFQKWSNNNISILTIAPDQPGALELIAHVSTNTNTKIFIGHHNANRSCIQKAVDLGAKAATHVGNGLNKYIHRFNNPLWPILADDRLYGCFITDGFHIPDDMIKTCIRAKGTSKFVVTSDVIHFSGMNPGEYTFKGADVVLESSGYLHRKNSTQLAGSTSTMMECMNYLASLNQLNLEELIKVGYENPLKILGIDLDTRKIKDLPTILYNNNHNHFKVKDSNII